MPFASWSSSMPSSSSETSIECPSIGSSSSILSAQDFAGGSQGIGEAWSVCALWTRRTFPPSLTSQHALHVFGHALLIRPERVQRQAIACISNKGRSASGDLPSDAIFLTTKVLNKNFARRTETLCFTVRARKKGR